MTVASAHHHKVGSVTELRRAIVRLACFSFLVGVVGAWLAYR
jgi:hypothetical protein